MQLFFSDASRRRRVTTIIVMMTPSLLLNFLTLSSVLASVLALSSTALRTGAAAPANQRSLDATLGVDWGAYITLKPKAESRWTTYIAEGLVSDRVVDLGGVWGKNIARDQLTLRVLSELSHGREVNEGVSTDGMVGCYASHLKFWQQARAVKAQRAVVFEEDAVLNPPTLRRIEAAWAQLPRDFDVALLGYIHLRGVMEPIPGNDAWVRVRGSFWGTQGYVVSADGAAVLERGALPIGSQVDAYMSWNAEFNETFKMYAPASSLVNQGSAILYNGNVQVRAALRVVSLRAVLPVLCSPLLHLSLSLSLSLSSVIIQYSN